MAILGLLVLIGVALAMVQGRFDPSLWRQQAATEGDLSAGTDKDAPVSTGLPQGLQPMSAPEQYTADNLSDKIDGKAELYLAAGFRRLETRRFVLSGAPESWMERYVYDMGSIRNAFAVFSTQRRPSAVPLDGIVYGYLAANGLFFVHGPYYVEIVAARTGEEILSSMRAMATRFAATHGPAGEAIAELALFPRENRVDGSETLVADSAFGIASMDGVFTAAYQDGTAMATAFLKRCASAEQARSMSDVFHGFWLEYGGESVASPAGPAGARMVNILDNIEIAAVHGDYFLGVHEATDPAFGVDLAVRLLGRIEESNP